MGVRATITKHTLTVIIHNHHFCTWEASQSHPSLPRRNTKLDRELFHIFSKVIIKYCYGNYLLSLLRSEFNQLKSIIVVQCCLCGRERVNLISIQNHQMNPHTCIFYGNCYPCSCYRTTAVKKCGGWGECWVECVVLCEWPGIWTQVALLHDHNLLLLTIRLATHTTLY